jgi:PhoD-like phosphatase
LSQGPRRHGKNADEVATSPSGAVLSPVVPSRVVRWRGEPRDPRRAAPHLLGCPRVCHIIDTRQYRSPNGETDGPDKTMLGAAQQQWLIDAVIGSRATWKVIVRSVSLSVPTGRLARDSWTSANLLGFPEEGAGFATERDAILDAFCRAAVANLVFLTADVHHAELLRHEPTAG